MKDKYKIGEKMIITEKIWNNDLDVGTIVTIDKFVEDDSIKAKEDGNVYISDQLECAVIYNTPLKKALKE